MKSVKSGKVMPWFQVSKSWKTAMKWVRRPISTTILENSGEKVEEMVNYTISSHLFFPAHSPSKKIVSVD